MMKQHEYETPLGGDYLLDCICHNALIEAFEIMYKKSPSTAAWLIYLHCHTARDLKIYITD